MSFDRDVHININTEKIINTQGHVLYRPGDGQDRAPADVVCLQFSSGQGLWGFPYLSPYEKGHSTAVPLLLRQS